MKRLKEDMYAFECSDKVLYIDGPGLGIDFASEYVFDSCGDGLEVYVRRFDDFDAPYMVRDTDVEFTLAERAELGEFMIHLWKQFIEKGAVK